MTETTIPTFILYCPISDKASVWLKGGAGPADLTLRPIARMLMLVAKSAIHPHAVLGIYW